MEPLLGQIMLFAGNFAPRGWAFCHGQLLSIAQNTALFSILGTTYGGNGQTTFALPDLRGRTAIGMGQGPGLSNYDLGETGGTEKVTLLASQLPPHNHDLKAVSTAATSGDPTGNLMAGSRGSVYASAGTAVSMSASAVTGGGANQPIATMPPYLGMNYIIATEGIFPSRD